MAKLIYSPLISDARNKIGDVVFSRWKGTPYARQRVTPANPKTPDQQAQRTALANCVAMWQSLAQKIKDAWKRAASAASISGFNAWTSANVNDERAGNIENLTPPVGEIGAIANLAAQQSAPGTIHVTWQQGNAQPTDIVYIAARKQGSNTIEQLSDTVPVSAGSADVTPTQGSGTYRIFAATRNADNRFAVTLHADIQYTAA